MANIRIYALGGQDENGKSSHVIQVERDLYLINAGISIPVQNKNGIDGLICDYSEIIKTKDNFRGVFLTHAHDEVFAALPWLIMQIPDIKIYGSKFTIEIAKTRVSKYQLSTKKHKFIEIDKEVKFDNSSIVPYGLANDIPGSNAYKIKTDDGDIIYMSSFVNKDLGVFGKTDLEEIKKGSDKVLALLMESKYSSHGGTSADKHSVKPSIEATFEKAKDNERILIGAYDENMYAIEEVFELAKKFNRPVAIFGSVFDFLYTTKNNLYNQKPICDLISYKDISKTPNVVVIVSSTWARLFQRIDRIARFNDVFLKLKPTDHWVTMAPPINGMEVESSQSLDEVAKTLFDIIDVDESSFYKFKAARDDIENTIKALQPEHFVPISGLFRYLSVANKIAIKNGVATAKTVMLKNGKIVYMQDGKIATQNSFIKRYGDVIIDGFGAGDISEVVIRERQTLGNSGLVSITLLFSPKKQEIVGKPNIQFVGVAIKSELKELEEFVSGIIIAETDKQKNNKKLDLRELQSDIRKRIRKRMFRKIGKESMSVVNVLFV